MTIIGGIVDEFKRKGESEERINEVWKYAIKYYWTNRKTTVESLVAMYAKIADFNAKQALEGHQAPKPAVEPRATVAPAKDAPPKETRAPPPAVST